MLVLLRRIAFWSVDFLKGGSFRQNYNEIKRLNQDFSDKKLINDRANHLSKILNHSISTTDYYQGLNINSKLGNFPIINKNIIRDNFSKFQSSEYINKKNYKVSTSGSTGTPFKTFLNKNKKIRNSADTIYFAEKSGFNVGKKLVYIRLWDEQHTKNKLSFWILNIMRHDITKLKDKDLESLCFKLKKDKSQKGFLAYASAYDSICKYLDKINSGPIECNVVSIIAISERLSDYAKNRMEYYFGCPVVSRYSASETGIIAQQEIGSNDFDINWGSYYIEILNTDDDKPVAYGKMGRIVITDLFNYAVPMIRYDTGDLGIMNLLEGNKAPVLSKVEGRKMDMLYDTEGRLITSHIVHQICLFKGINQYQLIQETKTSYRFKINAASDFNQEKELKETYQPYFGKGAEINVDYVDDIPLLSSGKRKKVINKYYASANNY